MAPDSGTDSAHQARHAIVEYLRLVSSVIPNGPAIAALKSVSIKRPESADYDGQEQEALHGNGRARSPPRR